MRILGVNSAYHEHSACLVVDGRVVAAVEEERFNRVKHGKRARVDSPDQLPEQAMDWCLASQGLRPEEIDHVAYSFDPARRLKCNVGLEDESRLLRGSWGTQEGEERFYRHNLLARDRLLARFPRARFHFLPHHLCHAAGAFLCSPFERAAILVADGIGEFASTWLGVGDGGAIKALQEVHYPNSLGFVWERMSEFLGFDAYSGPGKMMGYGCLTDPVGESTGCDYKALLDDWIRLLPDGGFAVDAEVFRFRTEDYSGLERWLGPRRQRVVYRYEEASIASALQERTEQVMLHLARRLDELVNGAPEPGSPRVDALCMSGGVALNCVANQRLVEESPFRRFHIQAAANDAGTAIGAALLVWCGVLGRERQPQPGHVYLGPEYGPVQIDAALRAAGASWRIVDDPAREAARRIAEGEIVAWFQGALEMGPRALGHRSILVDPTHFDARDLLNIRVKHREIFRPFAPSAIEEAVPELFGRERLAAPAELMLLAVPVAGPRVQQRIPAVVQVNGITGQATARVQVVREAVAPEYYRLIRELEPLCGVGAVLNTSFNISEPIVCSPAHALRTFARSEMDSLFLGDRLVTRR